MGLDIYSGTLTRYYARNWKTSVQKWAEENGMKFNIVRADTSEGEAVPPEEILSDVTSWRDSMIEALSKELSGRPHWAEDIDTTPYFTEKPDWDAVEALTLYTVCMALGEPVPETVPKNFDVYERPVYKRYAQQQSSMISLWNGGGWWLPFAESFAFKGYLPTGHEVVLATVGMLKNELMQINSLEWNADEQTILGWQHTEGYPADAAYKDGKVKYIEKHTEYNTVSLAKFAFSILWQAVRHSEQYGTLIIYDY